MVEIFENIRKIYTFHKPCEALSGYVDFFAESSVGQTKRYIKGDHFSVKMFSSFTPTFYINLGNAYTISVGGRHYFIGAHEDILILRSSIVERFNTPADNIFTVKFNPGCLEPFLPVKQVFLSGQVISLKQILPPQLLQQIKQPLTFNKRIQLMQNFLLSNLRKKEDHYLDFVKEAIALYARSDMQLSNNLLAEKMFTTSKTICRYFNNVIGTSPRKYFSVMRVRKALTAYVNGSKPFIPYHYGYYDMSHFYKDVTKFTGQKLTTVIL